MKALVVLVALPLLVAALEDNADFQRAKSLYAELEFEQAIFSLEQAALDESLTPAERGTVFAWMGLCHTQVRREDEGRRFFEMAVRSHAEVTLPDFAPPAVRGTLDEVRAELVAPARPAEPASPDGPVSEEDPATPAVSSTPDGTPEEPPRWGLLGGVGLGIVGGVAIAAAGVLFALAAPTAATARSEESFQDEAIEAANLANAELAAGGGLLVAGALLAGSGVGVALLLPE